MARREHPPPGATLLLQPLARPGRARLSHYCTTSVVRNPPARPMRKVSACSISRPLVSRRLHDDAGPRPHETLGGTRAKEDQRDVDPLAHCHSSIARSRPADQTAHVARFAASALSQAAHRPLARLLDGI